MLKQNCAGKRAHQTDVTLANPLEHTPAPAQGLLGDWNPRLPNPALSTRATAASVDPTQNTLAPQCPRGIIYLLPGA